MSERGAPLSDNEGVLLALVLRQQPITAYQIAKVYEESPVSNFSSSPGKIYPLVRRLEERGFLAREKVSGDSRGTEQLRCTDAGLEGVRTWLKDIRPAHLLPEDMLRTKLQSFELLSREEQVEWVVDARSGLTRKLEELERYREEVTVPYLELVHDNAVRAIRARLDWLDTVLHAVVKGTVRGLPPG